MSEKAKNEVYRLKTDGFHGELFRPEQDSYPGKALICFSGSDGRFEWSRTLAQIFQSHGLTALALAYVMEEGLPRAFYHVPIDPLEAAAERLHDMGYEKVGLWGISKGAELALTAGSLLPGLVNAVAAVAPMNTVCQGFSEERGITVMPGSAWSLHGEEVPYTPFGLDKFPMGQVVWKSLKAREVTMYDLYIPLVKNPDPAAVIRAEQIMGRLREKGFSYPYQHLNYDHGSHLFVPMELRLAKVFKGERGKYKELSRKARMDSLIKTLEFVSRW